jgi:hypothetical protein
MIVRTFITEYYSEDEIKTMEVLKQVMKENPDDNTKDKMKKVANTFLSFTNFSQTSY